MKEKLDLAILNDKTCKNKVLSVSKDFSKAIRKKIAVFEEERIRGKYLQNCYDHLKNIKPTSVTHFQQVEISSPNYAHHSRITP
jgi:low affinity Fe/Cu permease